MLEGGREGGREGEREGGREGGREEGREGGREGGGVKEGGREGLGKFNHSDCCSFGLHALVHVRSIVSPSECPWVLGIHGSNNRGVCAYTEKPVVRITYTHVKNRIIKMGGGRLHGDGCLLGTKQRKHKSKEKVRNLANDSVEVIASLIPRLTLAN